MKILSPIFFFLAVLFSVQSSAQDSSNNNPPVPKKTIKHRHIIKDSTLKAGSTSQDTLIAMIPNQTHY